MVMVANFIEFLIQNNVLEEKYREDTIYSMTLVLEKLVACTILFGVSFLLGKFMEGMVFVVCFLMLRQTTGGFHANTFLGCLIGSISTVVLVLEVLATLLAKHIVIFGVLCVLSIIVILFFTPVNHPDLMLTLEEQKKCRCWGRGVLFVEIGMVTAGYILQRQWQQYIMISIIVCAIYIIVAKLLRQEVKINEGRKDQ